MEHPCHRCEAPVEDGVPFCKNCGAPQIRVAGAVPLPDVLATPDVPPEPQLPQPASFHPPSKSGIQWSQAWRAAFFGGLLAVLSMAIPFPAFGLGLLGAGFLSVALYRRRAVTGLTFGMGARLGVACGTVGYVMFALLTSAGTLIFLKDAQVRETAIKTWEQWAANNPSLPIQEALRYARSPQDFAHMVTVSLVVALPIFLLFCGLGGVLGAAIMGRKRRL